MLTSLSFQNFKSWRDTGDVRLAQPGILGAILLATGLGALAAWAAVLSCYYTYGAATAKVEPWRTSMGNTPWDLLSGWVNSPTRPDFPRLAAILFGALVTAGLSAARARLLWWPFHPIGYVLAGTFTMPWLWCATLIGWAIKALTIRYGLEMYRRLLPFFIGLILGEYVAGSGWAIYGCLTGIQTYRVLPI